MGTFGEHDDGTLNEEWLKEAIKDYGSIENVFNRTFDLGKDAGYNEGYEAACRDMKNNSKK